MKKIKLYELFASLSKWEKNHFEDFLKSPYFNKQKEMLVFFNFINNASPKILEGNDYELAYKHVYPKNKFIKEKAYLLFSYLYKLLEKFMAHQAIEMDKALMEFHTARYYRKLKMEKPFIRKLEDSKKILSKDKLRNSEYLRRLYDLEYEQYDYLGSSNRTKNNLKQVGKAFDVYSISEAIRLYCFQNSHEIVTDKKYEAGMFKEVIDYVEDHSEYLEYPPIAIYYNYYQALFHKNSKTYFISLRQKIEAYKSHFTPTEIRDIYIAAINVCIKRFNEGQKANVEGQQYLEEIFELYKNGTEQEILFENGLLSRFIFVNVLSVSIKLKKLKWLERYIKKYKSKLDPDVRETIVNYATGVLRYEQKKYKQAMRLLAAVEINDPRLMLETKNVQLRIYYEIGELDLLTSLLDSMGVFIRRNKKNIGYHRELYLEIIKFTKKLISLPPYDRKKRVDLSKKAESIKLQTFKVWFLKQLEKA